MKLQSKLEQTAFGVLNLELHSIESLDRASLYRSLSEKNENDLHLMLQVPAELVSLVEAKKETVLNLIKNGGNRPSAHLGNIWSDISKRRELGDESWWPSDLNLSLVILPINSVDSTSWKLIHTWDSFDPELRKGLVALEKSKSPIGMLKTALTVAAIVASLAFAAKYLNL